MRHTTRKLATAAFALTLAALPLAGQASAQTGADTAGTATGTGAGTVTGTGAGTSTGTGTGTGTDMGANSNRTTRDEGGFNPGWLGLLGLAGLLGLMPKKTHPVVATHRANDTGTGAGTR